jgi:hypothetical protein
MKIQRNRAVGCSAWLGVPIVLCLIATVINVGVILECLSTRESLDELLGELHELEPSPPAPAKMPQAPKEPQSQLQAPTKSPSPASSADDVSRAEPDHPREQKFGGQSAFLTPNEKWAELFGN